MLESIDPPHTPHTQSPSQSQSQLSNTVTRCRDGVSNNYISSQLNSSNINNIGSNINDISNINTYNTSNMNSKLVGHSSQQSVYQSNDIKSMNAILLKEEMRTKLGGWYTKRHTLQPDGNVEEMATLIQVQ